MSHQQYLAMATWQRLVGNAVSAALTGSTAEAFESSREAVLKMRQAVFARVNALERQRQADRQRERERPSAARRVREIEVWQKAAKAAPELVDVLQQASDYTDLLPAISRLLEISEGEAEMTLRMPLHFLSPQGAGMLRGELAAKRKRLAEDPD